MADRVRMDSIDSFQMLPQLELIFDLPDGRIFEKTFAEMPDYASLWKAVRSQMSSSQQFDICIDGERLQNGNTVPKLQSVVDTVLFSTSEKRVVGICLQVNFTDKKAPSSPSAGMEKKNCMSCSGGLLPVGKSTLFQSEDKNEEKYLGDGVAKVAAESVVSCKVRGWDTAESRLALFQKLVKSYVIFPHGSVLKVQGQQEGDAGYLYLLLEGTCEVSVNGVVTSSLQPGAIFGEAGLMMMPCGSSVVVENCAKCYRLQYREVWGSEFRMEFEDLCAETKQEDTSSQKSTILSDLDAGQVLRAQPRAFTPRRYVDLRHPNRSTTPHIRAMPPCVPIGSTPPVVRTFPVILTKVSI